MEEGEIVVTSEETVGYGFAGEMEVMMEVRAEEVGSTFDSVEGVVVGRTIARERSGQVVAVVDNRIMVARRRPPQKAEKGRSVHTRWEVDVTHVSPESGSVPGQALKHMRCGL